MSKLNVNQEWSFLQKEIILTNRLDYSLKKRQMLFNFQMLLTALSSKNKREPEMLRSFYLDYKDKYLNVT